MSTSNVAAVVAFSVLVVIAASCGSDSAEPTINVPIETTTSVLSSEFSDGPPALMVRQGDDVHELDAFTYCWTIDDEGICADGEPASPLPSFDGTESITFAYPIDGWSFTASVLDPCDGATLAVQVNDDAWSIEGAGPAGSADVMIFGIGPEGDAAYAVEVVRQTETAPAAPRGWLTPFHLPGHEGVIDLWLGLDGPAELLDLSRASLIVSGTGPERFEIDLELVDADGCFASFRLPASTADDVEAVVGDKPWSYDIELERTDGTVFAGRASLEESTIDEAFIQDGFAVAFSPTDPSG